MKTTTALGWVAAAALMGWIAAGQFSTAQLGAAEKDDLLKVGVSLAESYAALAEIDLASALDANQRVAESFSAGEIARLQRVADAAKARVAAAKDNDKDPYSAFAASAAEAIRNAEGQLASAKVANEAAPGAVGPFELKRLETQLQIARLRRDQLNLLKTADPLDQLRWQVDLLASELSELKTRVLNFSIKN